MMHQCDYCCWYNERYGNCDCPYVMKKLACDKAKKEKVRCVSKECKRIFKKSGWVDLTITICFLHTKGLRL